MPKNKTIIKNFDGDTTLAELEAILGNIKIASRIQRSRVRKGTRFEVLLSSQGPAGQVWGEGDSWWAAIDDAFSKIRTHDAENQREQARMCN